MKRQEDEARSKGSLSRIGPASGAPGSSAPATCTLQTGELELHEAFHSLLDDWTPLLLQELDAAASFLLLHCADADDDASTHASCAFPSSFTLRHMPDRCYSAQHADLPPYAADVSSDQASLGGRKEEPAEVMGALESKGAREAIPAENLPTLHALMEGLQSDFNTLVLALGGPDFFCHP